MSMQDRIAINNMPAIANSVMYVPNMMCIACSRSALQSYPWCNQARHFYMLHTPKAMPTPPLQQARVDQTALHSVAHEFYVFACDLGCC